MIKIENTGVYGWNAASRGMRNPMNSWAKSDSSMFDEDGREYVHVGKADLKLMATLAKAGTDHGKFLRMITVYTDITAPLYWWKEFDTYKVGTVANSCSTMHKIHSKEFTIDDFSHEHLLECAEEHLCDTIDWLNFYREKYVHLKYKSYWLQMIQLLPSSYNQKRTVMLNYAVLRNMYDARKDHKLDEWRTLCEWMKSLPYAKELICDE